MFVTIPVIWLVEYKCLNYLDTYSLDTYNLDTYNLDTTYLQLFPPEQY